MKTALVNARVYTGRSFTEAVLYEDGIILKTGTEEEIRKEAEEVIDCGGRFLCAGFNDSHMHLLNLGKALTSPRYDLHTSSLQELLSYSKEFLKSLKEGQWLTGRGWNQDLFEDGKRIPDRHDLDEISTKIPVFLTRACGHCAVCNTRVLELCGIDENTEDPEGGLIVKEDGVPNGILYDNALSLVSSHIPLPEKEELKEMIINASKLLNSYGVTSVQSDDYCVYRELPYEIFDEAARELEAEGRLSVRIYEQGNFTNTKELQEYIEQGNRTGRGTGFFKKGPLKLLGDGSLGGRSAHLSIPYADDPSTSGFSLFTQEEFDSLISLAHKNGLQVAVHAIGDACLDEVLNAFEKALKKDPREDHRHGIVHCQISRPEQLERIRDLHLHVYAQPVFLDYDNHIVYVRSGGRLASSSYSWKTLMDMGVSVSSGSDAPVELPDVMKGIRCAVTRMSLDGTGPYLPEEAFTVKEAIDSFTGWGAYASFEEEKKGLLKEGYLADFVILEEDPFEKDPEQLHEIEVYRTYVNGKCVYERKSS